MGLGQLCVIIQEAITYWMNLLGTVNLADYLVFMYGYFNTTSNGHISEILSFSQSRGFNVVVALFAVDFHKRVRGERDHFFVGLEIASLHLEPNPGF